MISERQEAAVRAIAEYAHSVPGSVRTADRESPLIPPDLAIVCLWAVFGLSLTAAALVLGFADFGEFLTLAG
jgi:hypothetical protein